MKDENGRFLDFMMKGQHRYLLHEVQFHETQNEAWVCMIFGLYTRMSTWICLKGDTV